MRGLLPRTIRGRIIGLLLALGLPLIAIAAFAMVGEYRTRAERAEFSAAELAVATANGVEEVLDGGHAVAQALSREPAVLALDPTTCTPWLREITDMLPQYANIAAADSAGNIVCSAYPLPVERPSVLGRGWFTDVRATHRPVTGRYQVGNITGRPIVALAHPLFRGDSVFAGVVAVGIDLDHFQRLVEGLPQPDGAVVTLADDQWTVLARSAEPERWIGETLPGDTVPETAIAPGVGILKATGLDEVERVFGFATVPGSNWRVYAGVPEAWIYAALRAAAVRRGLAIAAVLAAVTLLTVLMFRRIAGSISALVEGTRKVAEREGTRVPEVGPAEVVAVARQFNATLAARERAEQELRRARERYESVLRNAPYGILVATPEGRIIDSNPALADMLGYPSAEALQGLPASTPFADEAAFEKCRDRVLTGERSQGEEVEWRRLDGNLVLVRMSCGLAVTPAGERILEVIAEDVTERRALEEHLLETRKMEAIGRLAGGVAHDFNNLLTIVRGQAQFLLLELGEDSPAAEHATEIMQASDRGARLTRQLLAFGRRQLVLPVPLDLNETVRNLQPMLRRVVGDDIRLMMRLGERLPPANADPGQVEQIVLNLVFNARDAMPAGGQVIIETAHATLSDEDARGRPGARAGDFVQLAVSDTGPGIPPDLIDRVFEPFFTTKPQGRGTGLGLATVYGIVTQSGGWIEVDSTEHGTDFTVFLPRSTESVQKEAAPADDIGAPGRGTVLVVEDEDAVRRVVAGTLRQRGYDVLEADSGPAALRVADTHDGPIELLVTDEMMPGMRGTQVAKEAVKRRPGLRILFMSGYADRLPTGATFAGVPSAFLAKPFSHQQLLRTVSALLQRDAVGARGGPGH